MAKSFELDVAVIGGGAAGFFAAIKAGESGARVSIFERTSKILSKVRVSGGGRCNVTHACFDPRELVKYYPRGGKELLGPFFRFHATHTIEWFESRGVELKTEPDGRVFPVTDRSQTIINCLVYESKQQDVKILSPEGVDEIEVLEGGGFLLSTQSERIMAEKVIIATGGYPKPEGFQWLADLGLEIVTPVPSLFTFNLPENNEMKELAGVSVPMGEVNIEGLKGSQRGPLLITHWGISGPGALKLSAVKARELATLNYTGTLVVNWLGENQDETAKRLQALRTSQPRKLIDNLRFEAIPKRLWTLLLDAAEIPVGLEAGQASNKHFNKLAEALCRSRYNFEGKTTNKEEFVTSGGVSVKEVDFKTMECLKIPGLHLAGEVLDIDGLTGGFNFQAAWTTGWLAGSH